MGELSAHDRFILGLEVLMGRIPFETTSSGEKSPSTCPSAHSASEDAQEQNRENP